VLEPGAVTEQLTVNERAVSVQTAEASLGMVLDTKPIENLPLNGRNPLHLMALLPGVSGHASQATSSTGTVTFSVNGDRGRGVYTTLDGVDVSDPVNPRGELSQVSMNPDSVSEYRVITSVAKAEYGRNAGAQVKWSRGKAPINSREPVRIPSQHGFQRQRLVQQPVRAWRARF
jgi:hypothetical protein